MHNYTKFAFKGQKMKNLTKNSVANVAKVGVASALIGAGLFLSACGGGDEFKPSSEAEKKAVVLVKEKYPDYKILSYDFYAKAYETSAKAYRKCLNDENKVVLFGVANDVFKSGDEMLTLMNARAFIVYSDGRDEKLFKLAPETMFGHFAREGYRGIRDCLKSEK